jgi:hypothetical protein
MRFRRQLGMLRSGLLVLLALSLLGCEKPPAPAPPSASSTERPNLVVVVVDDLRWDGSPPQVPISRRPTSTGRRRA